LGWHTAGAYSSEDEVLAQSIQDFTAKERAPVFFRELSNVEAADHWNGLFNLDSIHS
jgi:hypothetical protein